MPMRSIHSYTSRRYLSTCWRKFAKRGVMHYSQRTRDILATAEAAGLLTYSANGHTMEAMRPRGSVLVTATAECYAFDCAPGWANKLRGIRGDIAATMGSSVDIRDQGGGVVVIAVARQGQTSR